MQIFSQKSSSNIQFFRLALNGVQLEPASCNLIFDDYELVNDLGGFAHAWVQRNDRDDAELSLVSLADDEHVRAMQFGSLNKRRRYYQARVFLRALLSRYSGISAQELRFTNAFFGRPEFDNDRNIRFNLSHAGGVTACIVTRKHACGIDVEEIATRRYDPHLTARVLAPHEQLHVEHTLPHMRNKIFLEYWTLKEAYAKASGQGLALELDTIAFDRASNTTARIATLGERRAWRFYCWTALPEHVLSVAIKIE